LAAEAGTKPVRGEGVECWNQCGFSLSYSWACLAMSASELTAPIRERTMQRHLVEREMTSEGPTRNPPRKAGGG
jgi:hypothetical protein